MRTSLVAAIAFAATSLVACATARTITLSPEAQNVRVANVAPPTCRELADVFGKFESEDQEQAMIGAKIDIRNRTAKLGGDFVLLETNNGGAHTGSFNGISGSTHYNVLLGGKALLCGAPPAAAPPAAPAAL